MSIGNATDFREDLGLLDWWISFAVVGGVVALVWWLRVVVLPGSPLTIGSLGYNVRLGSWVAAG